MEIYIYCLADVTLSASYREPIQSLNPREFRRYFLPGLCLAFD